MTTANRNLPIGIQTFEKIRTGDYLYVDKTAMIVPFTFNLSKQFIK
nr:AAA family ATPase [Bacteroides sp. 224]